MSNIQVVADAETLAQTAAEVFVDLAVAATRTTGAFNVALAGGSTPKRMYALLADPKQLFSAHLPWHKIHFFWGDERHVAPDHPDSNYRMVQETMLGRVPIPIENVHRIKAENANATKAADDYERELVEFFQLTQGETPRLNLVVLGIGSDGHTASIFPGTDVLTEKVRLVAAPWVSKLNAYRITLTPRVLNNSCFILLLVSGEKKAKTLREVLEGTYRPNQYPVQLIRPENGRLLWLVDEDAASLL